MVDAPMAMQLRIAGVVGGLLMSAMAHAMHYCRGDERESDDDEPNTMYS